MLWLRNALVKFEKGEKAVVIEINRKGAGATVLFFELTKCDVQCDQVFISEHSSS